MGVKHSRGRWRKAWVPLLASYIRPDLVEDSKADLTQEVRDEVCAHCNGDQVTPKDDYVSAVDGGECDVGMDRTPLGTSGSKGVLSPINRQHSKHIKYNSNVNAKRIPHHCHWFKSKIGVSSQRTRAAAGAFMKWSVSKLWGRDRVRNRIRALCRKHRKQRETLLLVEEDDGLIGLSSKFSIAYLRHNTVVFDGSDVGQEPLENVDNVKNWKCIRIRDGGLRVCTPPNPSKGVMYKQEGDDEPRFILLPREEALKLNKGGGKLCLAMKRVMKFQRNIKRGKSKTIFSDNKYVCVGSKPRRNAPGVEPGCYQVQDGCSKEDWDVLMKGMRRCEHAFDSIAGANVIRQIREASSLVSWKKAESSVGKEGRIFNGIAFGMNVHLRAHVDQDFTYSVIQVHVDSMEYGVDDKVVCYFCFPRLGVAVAMRPGDILVMNALEYHCVSSRCRKDEDVFCLSCYLKTAVVGGNDNKRKLDKEERECLSAFDNAAGAAASRSMRKRRKK